jgi:beta-phosphoglucomutase-like phosphatase (HAD superfamily)
MGKGILFDKDGTLFDFGGLGFRGTEHFRNGRAFPYPQLFWTPSGSLRGDDTGFAGKALCRAAPLRKSSTYGPDLPKGRLRPAEAIARIFDEAATEDAVPIKTVAGPKPSSPGCGSAGTASGSSRRRPRIRGIRLEHTGLRGYFDFIAADGDGRPPKPHPRRPGISADSSASLRRIWPCSGTAEWTWTSPGTPISASWE